MAIQAQPLSKIRHKRVFVYRNLHKDCWSVKSKETGRVVAHADRVELSDVEFKVSESGRQRVLEEKSKNVHAGLVGTLEMFHVRGAEIPSATYVNGQDSDSNANNVSITYNPYKYKHFVVRETEAPVKHAKTAVLQADKKVFASNPTYFEEGLIAS
jgi:hypothetical protein